MFNSDEDQTPLYVNTPITRPTGYNTSLFPLSVDLYLDPECRYSIIVKNSFGQTASRIALQFSHWIPAHIVAILLLAFRYQIKITPEKETFKCGALNTAYLAGQTFFIITGEQYNTQLCRVEFIYNTYLFECSIKTSRACYCLE